MEALELTNLMPEPEEAWQRMLRFVGWGDGERAAAARSIETLFRSGHELVVQTYDYLRRVPETAAILGWEQHLDEAHLEERRRFFSIWLARTLGLDSSDEFARYLFRAGTFHAGHGPRHIHTPPEYVLGSVGLIQAAFARCMVEAKLPGEVVGEAMAAWSKYFAAQQNQMLLGYSAARELGRGAAEVRCAFYGRLRPLLHTDAVLVGIDSRATVGDVLRKLFNYYPHARAEALSRAWETEDRAGSLWEDVLPVFVPRQGWRVLLNGRDVQYAGGFTLPVHADDELALFPPGR